MNKHLYLHILLGLAFLLPGCNQDKGSAQSQFRERQQAILDRSTNEQPQATPPTAPAQGAAAPQQPAASLPTPNADAKPGATSGDKVVGVKDGDTIVLLQNGEEVTVRLYGVDTPEKTQEYGQKAKQFTSDLVFNKYVRLIPKNKDRYGRTVGTIVLADGRTLNEELVRNGYAWHYKAYSNDKNLANLEADARRYKRGLWQDANPTPPWDYRKEKRTGNSTASSNATAPVPAGATKRTVYICDSSGATVYYYQRNCASLKRCSHQIVAVTEADAIRKYNRHPDKSCGK